jgi:zinc/manganese transport system substrate-binding protein
VYLANTTRFVNDLRQARSAWEARLASARGREVLTFHRSLTYLADWLGLVVVDQVEPKPGIPPNPRHVAELIATSRQHSIKALLQESWYASNTSELVAQQIGATLIKLPGASDFQGGESYNVFMDRVVGLLAGAL